MHCFICNLSWTCGGKKNIIHRRLAADVRHAKWGDGVIIDIEGQGDKAEATVRFPEAGEKRLLLSWAPLEKLAR